MRPLVPAVAAAAVLVLAGCSEPEPGSPLPTGGGVATSEAPNAAPSETSSATPSTGGAEEPDEATATATATAEPPATPSDAPTLPPEAMTNDAAGAEAFVRYWLVTVNHAYATGELEPMISVSALDCRVCAAIEEEIRDYRDDDLTFVGGGIEATEVISPAPDGTGVGIVAVAYTQEASRVVDNRGRQIDSADARDVSIDAVIQREGDSWTLYDLGQ